MNLIVVALVLIGTGALILVGAPEIVAQVGLLRFSTNPIPGAHVTQPFKAPPNGHNGVDFGVPIGTPCLCVAPGTVEQVHNDPNNDSGRFVIVKGRFPYLPTIAWGYAHLSRIDVAAGQDLSAGDVVGLSGNTGLTGNGQDNTLNRTDGHGAHLHFTVLDVTRGLASMDPAAFLPEVIA